MSWDDRETEVRWVVMNSDVREQETNMEIAKKTVEPVNEPSHEIVPGTIKCIQVLLNITVAFSKYSCPVKEINFKNTLMFQVVLQLQILYLARKIIYDYFNIIDFIITI